jgi:hypothetical protein
MRFLKKVQRKEIMMLKKRYKLSSLQQPKLKNSRMSLAPLDLVLQTRKQKSKSKNQKP